MDIELKVGKRFASYKELKDYITKYEEAAYTQIYCYDSKKLSCTSLLKKCKTKITGANTNLLYYFLDYRCVHGGKYQFKGNNKRKSSTLRRNCPFRIKVSLSQDGQFLEIQKADLIHSHTVTEELYRALPKQRALAENEKSEVKQLLELRCNKKLVKNFIKTKTGKTLTLKDISNINTRMNKSLNISELEEAVQHLKGQENSTVEILVNDDNTLEGIYYQSMVMHNSFQTYPELLLCDATYKLNNLRMPLYIFLVINGNGQGEAAATFLLANENTDNIKETIQIFKKHNVCWSNVITVFTDKDFKERKAFADEFPNAKLLLCLFHTLKTFRTKITCEKMCINSAQRANCLKILQNIAFSMNESVYKQNYEKLIALNYEKVTQYFNDNWHDNRSEWVKGLIKNSVTYNITTTNHLESLNQKIKQVVLKNSSLVSFYKDLLILFGSIQDENRIKAYNMANKVPVHHYLKPSVEDSYINFLTPYASSFVLRNIEKAKNIKNVNQDIDFTIHDCNCSFRINMKLPCKHIFHARLINNEQLFEETLVDAKFTRRYYIAHQVRPMEQSSFNEMTATAETEIHQLVTSHKHILSSNEKYKKTLKVGEEIANLLSEYGNNDFNNVFEQLNLFRTYVQNRKEILVVEKVTGDLNKKSGEPSNVLSTDIKVVNCKEDNITESTKILEAKTIAPDEIEIDTLCGNSIYLDHGYCVGSWENLEEKPSVELKSININVHKMKRIGRPKGVDTTVIGLKKRKTK